MEPSRDGYADGFAPMYEFQKALLDRIFRVRRGPKIPAAGAVNHVLVPPYQLCECLSIPRIAILAQQFEIIVHGEFPEDISIQARQVGRKSTKSEKFFESETQWQI